MATRIAVMNDGLLQQIDTPQKLYDNPNNLFVAGFIGSPAMNFFPATLHRVDHQVIVDGGSFTVTIPTDRTRIYQPYDGKAIMFGIRPEDVHNPQFAPPGIVTQKIEAQVDVTELMGNEILCYLKTGETSFIARVDPRSSYRIGEKAEVVLNMGNIHIFDRDTKQAIR